MQRIGAERKGMFYFKFQIQYSKVNKGHYLGIYPERKGDKLSCILICERQQMKSRALACISKQMCFRRWIKVPKTVNITPYGR